MEGEANFTAGNLDNAITAYQEGVRLDPNDAKIWADLARIQTYSSAFLRSSTKSRLASVGVRQNSS